MSDDQWIMFEAAAGIVRAELGASIGKAEATTKAARASGEVRTRSRPIDDSDPVLLTNDDGLMTWNQKPGAAAPNIVTSDRKLLFNKDDLLDWLDRQHPSTTKPTAVAGARFPGDAALIEEGRHMLASGMQKRAIARKLAERAEGAGTLESKIDRLRRLL